jgi:hypothetical protein
MASVLPQGRMAQLNCSGCIVQWQLCGTWLQDRGRPGVLRASLGSLFADIVHQPRVGTACAYPVGDVCFQR